jgi:hypothetical protein
MRPPDRSEGLIDSRRTPRRTPQRLSDVGDPWSKDPIQPVGRPLQRGGRNVGIHVCRRREVGMSEHPRDHGELLAVFALQPRERVSQIVEPLAGEAGLAERVLECMRDVRRVPRRSVRRREHKTAVMPSLTGGESPQSWSRT